MYGIKENRLPISTMFATLNLKLQGHYQYYGITDNSPSIHIYYFKTIHALFKWLNRRSQKRSYTWEGFNDLLKIFPLARPSKHFLRLTVSKSQDEEPCALIAPVRICEGLSVARRSCYSTKNRHLDKVNR
ncbi:RNA-directed DNA polymerase [Acetonema longum DSM 6540]|uniref:RNA-directed DNA polymerase n=1 Tax=Acetonema longum DSM 6540 TaxID=1009370 RepID=F7NNP8_9FIRM|nr:RNA-directed DNA polymerase [Acetonema longum DSM 6540]